MLCPARLDRKSSPQMRHFGYLSAGQDEALFARVPQCFDASTDRRDLAVGLGATLYTPGTRTDYAERMGRLTSLGVASSVLCLEDAIRDRDVVAAERNVVDQLYRLHAARIPTPLLFVRVRRADQIDLLVDRLGPAAEALAGFVLPKFSSANGPAYLDAIAAARALTGLPLYAMPVLETGEVLYAECRIPELLRLRTLLQARAEMVLAVRIGATDLCGLYGLRRGPDLTIYDLAVVREAISDIVNVLGRDDALTITGPVWEYFSGGERMFKPQLRHTPFQVRPDLPHALTVRRRLITDDLDGLMREVVLDKATGIIGKTVIHPTHVRPVHALYVVTEEEFGDAAATLDLPDGGVDASAWANKMIESRPHARWATQIRRRAAAFGVLREDRTFVDLLDVEEVAS
jgi:citrate lyase beta subunit